MFITVVNAARAHFFIAALEFFVSASGTAMVGLHRANRTAA
jgi:hypothetical protein